MIWCSDCGCLSASGFSQTYLFRQECKRKSGEPVLEGSKGRLAKLRQGLRPVSFATTWPDGRPTSNTIRFKRHQQHVRQEPVLAPQPQVDYARRVDPETKARFYAHEPVIVTRRQQDMVGEAMEKLVEQYVDNDEFCSSHFRSLPLTPSQICVAIKAFLGSSFWYVVPASQRTLGESMGCCPHCERRPL